MKCTLGTATAVFIAVMLMTALGNYDWSLSLELVDRSSHFGEFFNRYGELPIFIALLISVGILFGGRRKELKLNNAVSHVLALPFMLLFSWAILAVPTRYIYEFDPQGIPASTFLATQLIGIALFTVVLTITYRAPASVCRAYRSTAVVIIAMIVIEIIVVNLTKIVWGRPRMRSIDSFEQFHYWYQVAGPAANEEFKSFPSGHTANGFMAIALTLLIPQDKSSVIKWLTALAIAWGVCVALSRVVLGAHFLSDVAAGGYIALCLFFSLKRFATVRSSS